jgi:hypothetical protein
VQLLRDAPPSCRLVLRRPDANPLASGACEMLAAIVIGANVTPMLGHGAQDMYCANQSSMGCGRRWNSM